MDYRLEKLEKELHDLDILWSRLECQWDNPSDWGDLYKVYPLLMTTACLSRHCVGDQKGYNVNIVRPSLGDTVDTTCYFYSDEKRFFNGKKETTSLKVISGLFLHWRETVYIDDRKNNGKMTKHVKIYLYIKTDKLCENCSLVNHGEYNSKGANYKKGVGFITLDNCLCGFYVEVRSYIDSLYKIVSFIKGKK